MRAAVGDSESHASRPYAVIDFDMMRFAMTTYVINAGLEVVGYEWQRAPLHNRMALAWVPQLQPCTHTSSLALWKAVEMK